ncbi:ABC-three component system protein [Paenibacillus sp. NPDC057934]|uniref:ABC-three component system protein n=1 Tax=Paenibacillus sp. NPDC057934 TaxID=3346282 RepID=UPI0036DA7A19
MGGTKQHTAAGQMAGYLFQPERALYWLAKSSDGSQIGIETEDDIVIKAINNEITGREQDKHSTSDNIPFGDSSKDLWNTLRIWCMAIQSNEVNVEQCQFHLVTNKILPEGITKRLGRAATDIDAKACLEELRRKAFTLPDYISEIGKQVCQSEDTVLLKLIKNIVVSDSADGAHGSELKDQVRSLLLIPSDVPYDEVYNGLLGWIHSCALNAWRNRKPAWLQRELFTLYYHRLLTKYKIRPFIETAKSLMPVSDGERNHYMNELFVRQLYLLSFEQSDDLLIDAIDDYLCNATERTRFSVAGNLTKEDLELFDEALSERWQLIHSVKKQTFKIKKRTSDDVQTLGELIGLEVLSETLDHNESLAGVATEQSYLTRGSYHHLANQMLVGWHPEYAQLLGGTDKNAK